MTLLGHIENGAVVLDDAVDLPEGAQVRIEVIPAESPKILHPEVQKIYGILRHVEDIDQARLQDIEEKHLL